MEMPRSGFGGGRDPYPFRLQPLDDSVPARRVGESAVHEHDGGPGSVLRVCVHRVTSGVSLIVRHGASTDLRRWLP